MEIHSQEYKPGVYIYFREATIETTAMSTDSMDITEPLINNN